MAELTDTQHHRQSPYEKHPCFPFRRANQLAGSALYWMPVSGYPMRAAEKQWLIALVAELGAALKKNLKWRQENFVNFDFIYPDLHEPMLRHSLEFNPIIGLLAQPSQPLFRPPSEKELQHMVASGDASKIRNATKNIAYWMAKNKGAKQLDIFFGCGAMMLVWLPETDETKPPDFRLPKKALANPAFKNLNVEAEIEFTYSLRDPFLAASKETFAAELKNDPQYGGMPFAVPLFTSSDILTAPGEFREKCLNLFGAYLAESRADSGVLLWGKAEIEPLLEAAVHALRDREMLYPTL